MSNISRRDILRGTAALGVSGGSLPLLSTRAEAMVPVVAILAVAVFVGGLIASANRRNVEAYLLQAVLEELQVIHQQLISIQEALAVVLTKLADLPKEISDIVAKESVRTVHAKILGQVQDFNSREMTQFPLADSDDQASRLRNWLNADAGRFDRLRGYQSEIAKLAGELRNSPLSCDPTAAMVLEFASETEFRLMVLCNMSPGRPKYGADYLVGTAEEYKKYFLRIKDEKVSDSAAWLRLTSLRNRDQLLSSISANRLGSLLKGNSPAIACAELHARHYMYGVSHNEARIYRSITLADFDPLGEPGAQELLRQIGLGNQQEANSAPALLFKKLVFDPPLEQPPSYEWRSVGFYRPGGMGGVSIRIATPAWKGGGSTDQCMAGDTKPGIPDSKQLEQTSKWDRLRYQYSPSGEELSRLYVQRVSATPDVPLVVLLDDLNVEEAKIAYAQVGLEAASRALENVENFIRYVKHL